jgi:hypothetical protein
MTDPESGEDPPVVIEITAGDGRFAPIVVEVANGDPNAIAEGIGEALRQYAAQPSPTHTTPMPARALNRGLASAFPPLPPGSQGIV